LRSLHPLDVYFLSYYLSNVFKARSLPFTGELLRKSASDIIACTSQHKAARVSNFIMLISPHCSPFISSFLFFLLLVCQFSLLVG